MFGNVLAIVAGLFSVLYAGTNRDYLRERITHVFSSIAIFDGYSYINIYKYLSFSDVTVNLIAWTFIVVLSFIISICVRMILSQFVSRKFKEMLVPIRSIVDKHTVNGSNHKNDLMVFLCEIRSIFCKYFNTNEIGISVFRLEADGSGAAMIQKFSIDFDGRVDECIEPARFSYGEGILGDAWRRQAPSFGKRTFMMFMYHPKYKKIPDTSDSANSFYCIPVADKGEENRITCAVSIESSSSVHFNWNARRDKAYIDVSRYISRVVARYIKHIYGNVGQDVIKQLPQAVNPH